jgi:hypothetical protein
MMSLEEGGGLEVNEVVGERSGLKVHEVIRKGKIDLK